jgi:hypothetical protein
VGQNGMAADSESADPGTRWRGDVSKLRTDSTRKRSLYANR